MARIGERFKFAVRTGLEHGLNSLDAPLEAWDVYVGSQARRD